jgi:hypothetical protein
MVEERRPTIAPKERVSMTQELSIIGMDIAKSVFRREHGMLGIIDELR